MKCDNCTEKCPQEELACEIAKGRMYATNEVVRLQKELKEIKTKTMVNAIKNLKVEGKALIVIPEKNEMIQKSVRNISQSIPQTLRGD